MTDEEIAQLLIINKHSLRKDLDTWVIKNNSELCGGYNTYLAGLKVGRNVNIHRGVETMKGFEIKREDETGACSKSVYLFNRFDVISAIYYTVNPESKMCIPNCAYERAEKEFDDWFNDTRIGRL